MYKIFQTNHFPYLGQSIWNIEQLKKWRKANAKQFAVLQDDKTGTWFGCAGLRWFSTGLLLPLLLKQHILKPGKSRVH